MKAELVKRLFRAIASGDQEAIDKLTYIVISEERKKGHTLLADQLENITKHQSKSNGSGRVPETERSLREKSDKSACSTTKHAMPEQAGTPIIQDLSTLPTSKRFDFPLITIVPPEKLRHHMVLPEKIEKRFRRIEREYAARDRLAHYGLRYRQKILLYGPPGCGKTLGAERLAWHTGLPMVKVRFDAIVSSFLGETASNLSVVFEKVDKMDCLLFLDECVVSESTTRSRFCARSGGISGHDSLAKSRSDPQEVGEIKRVVNTFLQLLDDYSPSSGMIVAATNLNESLDRALWRRFDDLIEVPLPGEQELRLILSEKFSTVEVGAIDWSRIIEQMSGFSAAQAEKVAQDAAKRAILDREELVIQPHLEEAIAEIKVV